MMATVNIGADLVEEIGLRNVFVNVVDDAAMRSAGRTAIDLDK